MVFTVTFRTSFSPLPFVFDSEAAYLVQLVLNCLANPTSIDNLRALLCSPLLQVEIDFLDKNPGIYSARWGGRHGDFNKAIKKVYRELNKKDKSWKNKKIKARFICALSISYLNKKIICVSGKVEGQISHNPKGKNGFGYDPIFIPNNKNKTFGEMKPSYKYKIDHRFKAFKKIRKFF